MGHTQQLVNKPRLFQQLSLTKEKNHQLEVCIEEIHKGSLNTMNSERFCRQLLRLRSKGTVTEDHAVLSGRTMPFVGTNC